MPVWESEKGLERKPLFRSLQSIPTGGWVSLLLSSPCHEPKNIRILKLWKNHRSASPITTYFKELTCYENDYLFLITIFPFFHPSTLPCFIHGMPDNRCSPSFGRGSPCTTSWSFSSRVLWVAFHSVRYLHDTPDSPSLRGPRDGGERRRHHPVAGRCASMKTLGHSYGTV